MLKEFRYKNSFGTYEYFMADPQRAVSLMVKGIKVEVKTADPFISSCWSLFDPEVGIRRNNHRRGAAKYDYETFKKMMDLRYLGLLLSEISEITGIKISTISHLMRGLNSGGRESTIYEGYLKRYKQEKKEEAWQK